MQLEGTHSEPLLSGRRVYCAVSYYQHPLAHYKDQEQEGQDIDHVPKVT